MDDFAVKSSQMQVRWGDCVHVLTCVALDCIKDQMSIYVSLSWSFSVDDWTCGWANKSLIIQHVHTKLTPHCN